MKITALISACALLGVTCSSASIIFDEFDDGNIAQNVNGIGSGFLADAGVTEVLNVANLLATEAGINPSASMVSIDQFDTLNASSAVTLSFNIFASTFQSSDGDKNEMMMMMSDDDGDRSFGLVAQRSDGEGLRLIIQGTYLNGGNKAVEEFFADTTLGPEALTRTNYTVQITVDSAIDFWGVSILDNIGATNLLSATGDFTSSAGGSVDAFIGPDTRVFASVGAKGGGSIVELAFDSVAVVPEPAVLSLLGLCGGGMFFYRRIFGRKS